MVKPAEHPQGKRVTYKTYIALFPIEWRKLRAEAERRQVPGAEVIGAILSQAIGRMPNPPIVPDEPLPEDRGD